MEDNTMLITKLVLRPDNHVDLYGRGHKYKDLTLFDATDLADVGIDVSDLQPGVETPCRFIAEYELSDKLNQSGNPYKDVVALRPVGGGSVRQSAPASAPAGDAILAELRAIRAELARMHRLMAQALASGSLDDAPGTVDVEPTEPIPDTDEPPDEDGAEVVEAAGATPHPLSDAMAKRMFMSMAGDAVRGGVDHAQVNTLMADARTTTGWRDALEALQALIEQADDPESELEAV